MQFDIIKSHEKSHPIASNGTVHIATTYVAAIMKVSSTTFNWFHCELHRFLLNEVANCNEISSAKRSDVWVWNHAEVAISKPYQYELGLKKGKKNFSPRKHCKLKNSPLQRLRPAAWIEVVIFLKECSAIKSKSSPLLYHVFNVQTQQLKITIQYLNRLFNNKIHEFQCANDVCSCASKIATYQPKKNCNIMHI